MHYLLFALFVFNLHAQVQSLTEISFESRFYKDDNDPTTIDKGNTFSVRADLEYSKDKFKGKFIGSFRHDFEDPARDLKNLEDLWAEYRSGRFSLRLGNQVLNWTALEAFHPADTINSRSLDGEVENFPKLGELILKSNYEMAGFNLTALYMPRFVEPKLPFEQNRLGSNVNIWDIAFYDGRHKSQDQWVNQYALRLTGLLWGGDLALNFVHHIDRSNGVAEVLNDGSYRVNYFRKKQASFTFERPIADFLFKLEGAFNDYESTPLTTLRGEFELKDHGLIANGFEYGFEHQSGLESIFLFEAQYLFGADQDEAVLLNAFQSDILLGYLLLFNDINSKELKLTLVTDFIREDQYILNFSYSQRLNDQWKLSVGSRYIDATPRDRLTILFIGEIPDPKGIETYDQDHQVWLKLSRFF